MGKPTHEQIARLAYLIWQYTEGTRSEGCNWLEAEDLLRHGVVSTDDPNPIVTLIEAEYVI